jgi:hypothetical protein
VQLFPSSLQKEVIVQNHHRIRPATGAQFLEIVEELENEKAQGIEITRRSFIRTRIKVLRKFIKHLNWSVGFRYQLEVLREIEEEIQEEEAADIALVDFYLGKLIIGHCKLIPNV